MKRNGFVLTVLMSASVVAGAAEIEGLAYDATVNVKGTGFFRVEQENGVWRFVTPGGHGFFFAGNNGPSRMAGDSCPALGYSPYTEAMKKKYGRDVARWAADTNARLKSWGFNVVSTWDDPPPGIITNGLVHARVLQLGRSFASNTPNSDSNLLDNVNCKGKFPNVFRPDFADHCLKMARKACARRRDDPNLVGWYTDNELSWRGAVKSDENHISEDAHDGAGMYDAVVQLPPGHSGRQALERYLAECRRKITDPVSLEVKQGFLRLVAREYYRITTSAIRAADPNHLLLGCRFAGFRSTPDIAWEEGGKWNDVMTANVYPPADLEKGVILAGFKDKRPFREKLRDVYALCKRPIIITEWAYRAEDTGHPNKVGAGQRVPTQKERAAASALFVRTLLSEPCVVGHVHFRWVDEPKLGRWKMVGGEDSNYGLVNEDGEPYALLTEAFAEVHSKMYDYRHACIAAGALQAPDAAFATASKKYWNGISPSVEEWERTRRAETLKWFEEHQFGKTPVGRLPDQVIGETSVAFTNAGVRINITCRLPKGADAALPAPVFLFGDHRGGSKPPFVQEEYAGIPTNSITARGYAYVRWNFNDVCPNVALYTKALDWWPVGIIAYLATGDRNATNVVRTASSWGTIGAWAWGNSRVMDWIESRPELDARRVAVVGHSRGGKTALWTAAQDTRFAMAVSNGSGCGGARLGRANDPKAETFEKILHTFPNWFCPAFAEWIGRDAEVPHDADDLIRLIAPRLVYVASGSEDAWAGPAAEKAAWDAAHDLYRAYGHEERMGYHCHEGPHKLGPDDWNRFLDFADRHL